MLSSDTVKRVLHVIEVVLLVAAALFAVLWIRDPAGNYEPPFALCTVLLLVLAPIRRKLQAASEANSKLLHKYTLRVEGPASRHSGFVESLRALERVQSQSRIITSQEPDVTKIVIFSQGPVGDSDIGLVAAKHGVKVLTHGLTNPLSGEKG